jgi:hypothetical protein
MLNIFGYFRNFQVKRRKDFIHISLQSRIFAFIFRIILVLNLDYKSVNAKI